MANIPHIDELIFGKKQTKDTVNTPDNDELMFGKMPQESQVDFTKIHVDDLINGGLIQPIIPPGTPHEIPASETAFNLPKVATPAQVRPTNKVDQLLSSFQQAAQQPPAGQTQQPVNPEHERIALEHPELYPEFSKRKKEGLSDQAAFSVANAQQMKKEQKGKPVEKKDSIGTPWSMGINRLLQLPGNMAKMIPSVLGFMAPTTGLASTPAGLLADMGMGRLTPTGKADIQKATETYQAAKPFADSLAESVERFANEKSPYKKPTGKYARPAGKFTDYFDPKRAYMTIAQNVPQMLGFVASTVINPTFGLMVMGSAEGAETVDNIQEYEQRTGKTVDPQTKILAPVFVGSVNAALEKTGIDQILKVAKVPGLKGKMIQGIIANVTEGSQEGLQEVTQILGEYSYDEEAKTWKGQLPRILESVYGGVLLGLLGSVTSGTAGYLSDQYIKEAIKKNIPVEGQQNQETVSSEEPQTEAQQAQEEIEEKASKGDLFHLEPQKQRTQPPADQVQPEPTKPAEKPVQNPIDAFIDEENKILETEAQRTAPENESEVRARQKRLQDDLPGYIDEKIASLEQGGQQFPELQDSFNQQIAKLQEIKENAARVRNNEVQVPPAIPETGNVERGSVESGQDQSREDLEQRSPGEPGISGERVEEQSKEQDSAPAEAKEETPNVEQEPESSKAYKVTDIPLEDVNINKQAFQNRESDFSQETVDSILGDIDNKSFKWEKFDPVKLWKNPEDGKLYVLAGHSRLAAFKKAVEQGHAEFSKIPSFIVEGKTFEEAQEFALRESNTLGSREENYERAKIYRDMRQAGKSKKDIMAEAFKNEKKNAATVINLSYLNFKGESVGLMKALKGTTMANDARKAEAIADYIGAARKTFPELTDQHEDEMFKWLMSGVFDKFQRREEFINRIGNITQRFDFDPKQPLNLMNISSLGSAEAKYNEQVAEKEKELTQAKKKLDDFRKRAIADGIENIGELPAVIRMNDEVAALEKELLGLKQQKGNAKKSDQAQGDMFGSMLDSVADEINKEGVKDEVIRDISGRLAGNKDEDIQRADVEITAAEIEKKPEPGDQEESSRDREKVQPSRLGEQEIPGDKEYEKDSFQVGDIVEYDGEVWEIGYIGRPWDDDANIMRLQKYVGESNRKDKHNVRPENVKLIAARPSGFPQVQHNVKDFEKKEDEKPKKVVQKPESKKHTKDSVFKLIDIAIQGTKIQQEEADMVKAIISTFARNWAKWNNKTEDEFFETAIADITFADEKDHINSLISSLSNDNIRREEFFKAGFDLSNLQLQGQTAWDKGQATIRLFKNAQVDALLHEFGHVFNRFLPVEDYKRLTQWAEGKKDVDVNAMWSKDARERFAIAFEKYILEGDVPNQELQSVFTKLKDLLLQIYQSCTRFGHNFQLSNEVRDTFDKMLAGEPKKELKRPEISPLTQSRDAVIPLPDKHKLVSSSRYEELKKRMQDKLNNLNVGVDPELFAIGTEMAVYQIEEGVIKFADFSKKMISEFGEKIRPYLKSFYLGARHYPGVDNTGMDTEADIEKIEKELTLSQKQESAKKSKTSGHERLSDMVYERLKSGEGIKNNPELTTLAEQAFGGTRAQGTFDSSDMYNALEAGINKYLLSKSSLMTNKTITPKDHLLVIQNAVMEKIPTQADRSAEKDLLQQFSTPPTLAYVAAQALNANENDVVLEPSAGTGNLAIFPKAAGAKVYVNEIDEQRRKALEYLGFDTTNVDAEFLDSILPQEIRPTAIIMNPPFSSTGGRISKNDTKYGFRHLDNALTRLADNGRLVAIMGESAGLDRINSAEWWKVTFKKYNVRAIIGIPGKVYQKYGTNFGSLLVIIDKTGPTPGNTLAENLENVVNLSVTNLEEALDAIQRLQDQAGEGELGEIINRFFKEKAVDTAWTEEAAEILSKGNQGVKVYNTKEAFEKRLAELGQAGQAKQGAIAFFDQQSNSIYINPDRATKDTIFHEFAHPFINHLKKTNPELYQQGIDLVKGTWYETKATMERYADPLDEGLVMAIGEKGAQIQDEVKRNRFIAWLKRVWIKARMLFKKIFDISLSLDDFVSMMAYQMLSGKRIVPAPGEKVDTQSGAFKRWFGNSKVVDGKGRPLVVYHGTIGDFSEFKLTTDIGYHFGTAPQANARIESKDRLKRSLEKNVIPYTNIMPAYLSIQNPLRLDDLSLWQPEDILDNLVRKGIINQLTKFIQLRKLKNIPEVDKWYLLRNYIEDLGYDGIVYKNKHEYDQGRDSWIAFRPEQIKSATGNRGTFDPKNPDIRFQVKSREDQYVDQLVELYQKSGASDKIGFMKYLTAKGYSPQYVIQAGRDWEVVEDINNGTEAPGMELPKETIWQGIQRIFQDKYNRSTLVINEAKKAGENITDDINFRLQMELYIGRAADQIEKLEKKLTNGKNGFLERLADAGLNIDDMGWYLYAKHAKERNRYIKENRDEDNDAGSGLTDDEADEILNHFANTNIVQFADEFYDLVTRPALKMLYDNALVGEEEYNNYINTYEYYVPLKNDKGDTIMRSTGQHFSVGSRGIIKAKGRHSLAVNPFLQAIMDYESAMIRIEKNKVGQTLLAFVRQHQNPDLWVVTGRRKIPVYNADGEIEFFRNVEPIQDNQFSVWEHVKDRETGQMLTKQKIITIKDELLINGLKNVGAENWTRAIKIMEGVNTWLRAVNTVINPEFIITNFERDLQTAMVNLSEVEIKGMKKKVLADIPKAMKGIYSELRGKKGQEWINWFEDFKEQGGKTGWIESLDIEQKKKKFQDKIRFYQKAGKTEQIIKATGEFIFDLNETVENAVRVATYKNAVQAGMSKAQAASLAKNLTLNFNKKGEWGTVLNTMYLFSNAGIQGGARLLLALKNKKVRKAVTGLIIASIIANILNRLIDDDEYEKIPEYVRDTNWIFMLPGMDGKYLMVKLPYGYNVFNVVGNVLADSFQKMRAGVYDYSEFLHQSGRILSAIVDAFNPLGSSGSLGQLISPTIGDLPLQLAENKNFFGAPIRKEQAPYAPDRPYSQMYFKSVNPLTKAVTDALHEWTGGNEFKAGKIELNPEDLDHIVQFIGGGLGTLLTNTVKTGAALIQESEVPDLNRIPFIRKFIGQPGEWTGMREVREMLDESGRTLYSDKRRELFRQKLDALYDEDKIDNTQYQRYLSTFNNAQNRLDDLELPGSRLAEKEPKRLVRKTAGVPPKRELQRLPKKELKRKVLAD